MYICLSKSTNGLSEGFNGDSIQSTIGNYKYLDKYINRQVFALSNVVIIKCVISVDVLPNPFSE